MIFEVSLFYNYRINSLFYLLALYLFFLTYFPQYFVATPQTMSHVPQKTAGAPSQKMLLELPNASAIENTTPTWGGATRARAESSAVNSTRRSFSFMASARPPAAVAAAAAASSS